MIYDPDPDRAHEQQRDESLTTPGSQNYETQLASECDACERYWSDESIADYRVLGP